MCTVTAHRAGSNPVWHRWLLLEVSAAKVEGGARNSSGRCLAVGSPSTRRDCSLSLLQGLFREAAVMSRPIAQRTPRQMIGRPSCSCGRAAGRSRVGPAPWILPHQRPVPLRGKPRMRRGPPHARGWPGLPSGPGTRWPPARGAVPTRRQPHQGGDASRRDSRWAAAGVDAAAHSDLAGPGNSVPIKSSS